MEKDPEVVRDLARKFEDQNWRFRSYLKMSLRLSHRRIDATAARFGREAQDQMDCTTCAACCRNNWVPVDDHETGRLAARLNMEVDDFRARYVTADEVGEPGIDARPCPFIEGNLCSVYEDRPDVCRGYPYVGGNIVFRMSGIIERAATCPIIFDMLERLKTELGYHRYR